MKTTTNLVVRLNNITVGHTTIVCDVAVTRWTAGFELETVGRATAFLSAEAAAAKLLENAGRKAFEHFTANHPIPSLRNRRTWEELPEEARQGWIADAT